VTISSNIPGESSGLCKGCRHQSCHGKSCVEWWRQYILVCLVVLAGCETIQDSEPIRLPPVEVIARDQCDSLGVREDSPQRADCLMRMFQAENERRAAILNLMLQEDATDDRRRASQPSPQYPPLRLPSPPPPPTQTICRYDALSDTVRCTAR